jgi:hypothetical protein
MNEAFEKLCKAVPPPSAPVDSGAMEDFAALEASMNINLPDDYKRLVCNYGSGSWKEFLWVLNPFASNRNLNLGEQAQRQLDAERTIKKSSPRDMPFALHPEPGGLFPWGLTDNGDRLFWLTEGNPNSWPTIVYESRGPEFDRHEINCCTFLRTWISGELQVKVFPDDFEYGFDGAFTPA